MIYSHSDLAVAKTQQCMVQAMHPYCCLLSRAGMDIDMVCIHVLVFMQYTFKSCMMGTAKELQGLLQ